MNHSMMYPLRLTLPTAHPLSQSVAITANSSMWTLSSNLSLSSVVKSET